MDKSRPGLHVVVRHFVAGARESQSPAPDRRPVTPLFDKHALEKSKGLFESDNYVKKRYKEVGRKIFKK